MDGLLYFLGGYGLDVHYWCQNCAEVQLVK